MSRGDWLCDGKRHYGDGLYEEAAKLLGLESRYLENLKQVADRFEITQRCVDLTWGHHREVSSLRPTIIIDKGKQKGKWALGDEPDHTKMARAGEVIEDMQRRGELATRGRPEKRKCCTVQHFWRTYSGRMHAASPSVIRQLTRPASTNTATPLIGSGTSRATAA